MLCLCQIYLTQGELRLSNQRMINLRLEQSMTQADLAKRIGVSRQTINMIENGGYNPTLELCIRICKELGVTLNDLFWEE